MKSMTSRLRVQRTGNQTCDDGDERFQGVPGHGEVLEPLALENEFFRLRPRQRDRGCVRGGVALHRTRFNEPKPQEKRRSGSGSDGAVR